MARTIFLALFLHIGNPPFLISGLNLPMKSLICNKLKKLCFGLTSKQLVCIN
jgi:hypothetical protein